MPTLSPEDYWKLRALDADVQRAQAALALSQQQLSLSQTKRHAYWASLIEKYQLDPQQNYRADDEDCSLTGNGVPTGDRST